MIEKCNQKYGWLVHRFFGMNGTVILPMISFRNQYAAPRGVFDVVAYIFSDVKIASTEYIREKWFSLDDLLQAHIHAFFNGQFQYRVCF